MTGVEDLRKRYGEKLAANGRYFVVQSGIVLGLDGEVNG